jgi:malonyl-CoA O-methyltransferase
MPLKHHIATSFSRAAATYNSVATVQAEAATGLLNFYQMHSARQPKTILEIGCGTGILSEKLLVAYPDAAYIFTDIAEKMLHQHRTTVAHNGMYVVADGEHLPFTQKFDLIISNMTCQWFSTLWQSLEKLLENLNTGGVLCVNLLSNETFQEWRNALETAGAQGVGLQYPAASTIQNHAFSGCTTIQKWQKIQEHYPTRQHFTNALKNLGVQAANAVVSRAVLRKALAHFASQECTVTYSIHTLFIQKQGGTL